MGCHRCSKKKQVLKLVVQTLDFQTPMKSLLEYEPVLDLDLKKLHLSCLMVNCLNFMSIADSQGPGNVGSDEKLILACLVLEITVLLSTCCSVLHGCLYRNMRSLYYVDVST